MIEKVEEGLADSLKKCLEEKVPSANRLHEAGEWIEKRRIRMKKLLILAGLGVHSKVVETAKKMGIYTVVTDYLEDSPAKRLADERLMYDIFDVDGLIAWGKAHHIDGVLDFCCDPAQKPAQQIAEALHLPVFGSSDQVNVLTNKKQFKQFCSENGVDVIPSWNPKVFFGGGGTFRAVQSL